MDSIHFGDDKGIVTIFDEGSFDEPNSPLQSWLFKDYAIKVAVSGASEKCTLKLSNHGLMGRNADRTGEWESWGESEEDEMAQRQYAVINGEIPSLKHRVGEKIFSVFSYPARVLLKSLPT
jgi:hypothetical protein